MVMAGTLTFHHQMRIDLNQLSHGLETDGDYRRIHQEDFRKHLETWYVYPLTDQWTAAFRLVPQDGRPVIGELRIYPTEQGAKPGEWSGSTGQTSPEVPRGGLTARAIRQVRTDEALREVHSHMDAWITRHGIKAVLAAGALFDRFGFTEQGIEDIDQARGRPRKYQDADYALIAKLYVEASMEEPRKVLQALIPKLAEHKLGNDIHAARSLVQGARRHGMLTSTRRGVAGGQITARARAFLEEGGKR